MPVQITPFNPVNLSDLVRDKRNFNADQQQRGIANAQNDRRLAQGDQRVKISMAQMEAAAAEARQSREEFIANTVLGVAAKSEGPDQTYDFMANSFAMPPKALEKLRQTVNGLPQNAFGVEARAHQLARDKLSQQAQKVVGAGDKVVDTLTGEVIAEGGAKPLTVTDQLKLDAAKKQEESKAKTKTEVGQIAADLLMSNDFEAVYGTMDSFAPTFFQSTADAEADIDKLVSLLSLEARDKLTGTGTISDFESKQLAESASVLARKNISDEKARAELEKIRDIFGGIQPRKQATGEKEGRFTIRVK